MFMKQQNEFKKEMVPYFFVMLVNVDFKDAAMCHFHFIEIDRSCFQRIKKMFLYNFKKCIPAYFFYRISVCIYNVSFVSLT